MKQLHLRCNQVSNNAPTVINSFGDISFFSPPNTFTKIDRGNYLLHLGSDVMDDVLGNNWTPRTSILCSFLSDTQSFKFTWKIIDVDQVLLFFVNANGDAIDIGGDFSLTIFVDDTNVT